jgi:hypothetical protein
LLEARVWPRTSCPPFTEVRRSLCARDVPLPPRRQPHDSPKRPCGRQKPTPCDLAAPANADGDLQWGQGAAGFGKSGQGEEGSEPVPDFADCGGPDATGWLGEGEEEGVEEARKVGKAATDRCLDESERGTRASSRLLVAALMCSYVQPLGPPADPWSRDFRTLLRISPVTTAEGVPGVGTGGMGSAGCRACSTTRTWHTSGVESRMGWASKDCVAREMPPMTIALQYRSGPWEEGGVPGGRGGSLSRDSSFSIRCRRAWVRLACPPGSGPGREIAG